MDVVFNDLTAAVNVKANTASITAIVPALQGVNRCLQSYSVFINHRAGLHECHRTSFFGRCDMMGKLKTVVALQRVDITGLNKKIDIENARLNAI